MIGHFLHPLHKKNRKIVQKGTIDKKSHNLLVIMVGTLQTYENGITITKKDRKAFSAVLAMRSKIMALN